MHAHAHAHTFLILDNYLNRINYTFSFSSIVKIQF